MSLNFLPFPQLSPFFVQSLASVPPDAFSSTDTLFDPDAIVAPNSPRPQPDPQATLIVHFPPLPAANATYVFNHTRFYLPMNEPARNNSIHGLLWNKTMTVVAHAADDNHAFVRLEFVFNQHRIEEPGGWRGLRCTRMPSFPGSGPVFASGRVADTPPLHAGYPFQVQVQVDYNLTAEGLSVTHRATNLDQHWPAPFFDSCHPYFLCNVSTTFVVFDPCTRWNHVRHAPLDAGLAEAWLSQDGQRRSAC